MTKKEKEKKRDRELSHLSDFWLRYVVFLSSVNCFQQTDKQTNNNNKRSVCVCVGGGGGGVTRKLRRIQPTGNVHFLQLCLCCSFMVRS